MEKMIGAECLLPFPEAKKAEVDRLLLQEIEADTKKIVVLDDDPTGVQTVHDVSVYTDWSLESLRQGFSEKNKMFFVLTNSRGMTTAETTVLHHELIQNIAVVSKEMGIEPVIVSRSDSTLRGHFPLETQLIREEMEKELGIVMDGEVLCPFFREGGRFTIEDVHYVRYGEQLIPAAQTEFANDKTFGYAHSNLKEYIEEKTKGAYPAEKVVSISLKEIRSLSYDVIEDKLLSVSNFGKMIVNAIDPYDIKVFAVALYRAMGKKHHFCFRCAATLAQVLGGVQERPLLKRQEMISENIERGGIVIVGSHTQKTTVQLMELLKLKNVVPIEMNSDLVLEGETALQREARTISRHCDEWIAKGKTPVVYTKRHLLTVANDSPEAALTRSVQISNAVQSIVGALQESPAFIVAKGGITSSDIGTKALRVRRAMVLGQICPGIPVWKTGAESRFPGIAYVIFPGNVGAETTLREVVERLS